jgi:exonuclease VII small subunit
LNRIGRGGLVAAVDPDVIAKLAAQPAAQDAISSLKPAHLPALFPEVFLRKDAGFDALIGNPPWDMVHVEEDVWWGKFIPGARGLPVKEMNSVIAKFRKSRPDLESEFERERNSSDTLRAALLAGPYPGIGSGHVDLYQVFAWRNLQTCNSTGTIGLVLPRVALSGSGSAQWRAEVLSTGSIDSVFVVNNKEWVFKGVHGSYTIAFVTVRPKSKTPSVRLSGPFFSKEDFEKDWNNQVVLTKKTISDGSPTLAIPLLSSPETGAVYEQMRSSPSLSSHPMFQARPVQGDLNASADKAQFVKGGSLDDKRVPVFAGATFEIWNPDFGQPYGAANFEKISKWLLAKCQSASRNSRSAHFGSEYKVVEDIPFSSPRIAYRGVSNATNSRTFICCLVPPKVVMTHGSPFFKFISGEPTDEPYLLGVMSSLPFDWYMRKWVELNVTFELVSPAPIPEIVRSDIRYKRLVALSVKIGATDKRFSQWAKKFDEKAGTLKQQQEKDEAIAEIDALVANLYGLSRLQLEHVFKTFHRGWEYSSRLEQVLAFYDQLPKVKS